jgi:cytochrome c-type biogenesis protein CcmH
VRRARVRLLVAAALVAAALSPASAQSKAVSEDTVHEVAARLRCVVCQNLSVADSPSEMAGQMRAIIRERLAAGESPDEVQRYFVQRYGEWILLSPPRHGFNLLVWLLPLVFVIAGLVVVGMLVRQWTRRPRGAAEPVAVDPAMSERIRREVERGS